MTQSIEFVLKEFERRVLEAYRVIKWEYARKDFFDGVYDPDSVFKLKPEMPRSYFGKLVRNLNRHLNGLYFKNSDVKRRKSEAERILHNREVITLLCPILKEKVAKLSGEDLEAKTIRIVARTLSADNVKEEFQIVPEPRLFATIVFELLKTGVENYCHSHNHDPEYSSYCSQLHDDW